MQERSLKFLPLFRSDQSKKMFQSTLLIFVVFFVFSAFDVSSQPDPKIMAHEIYQKVLSKMNANETIGRQWAYLYLHRQEDNEFNCTNPEVNRILNESGTDKIPKLCEEDIWPTTNQSNLRVAGLKGTRRSTNIGHSEQRLLQEFEGMMKSEFPGNKCPAFIILSTRLFPCCDRKGTGCGTDFVKETKSVFERCATNDTKKFRYIYIYKKSDWNIQKEHFRNNSIPILFGPE